MNILTFDIEEWFHILDVDSARTEEQWKNYEVRIYENIERIFKLLDSANINATFFIIGWIARMYPDLVRNIADKYEIGSHTMNHQIVWQQSPNEFRRDVESSVKMLEDITGKKVNTFRAPGFSIRNTEGWAFEILSELGITKDCSVFPAKHAHGGMPQIKTIEPFLLEYNGIKLKEFPIVVKYIFGKPLPFSGGGYFRLFPYPFIKRWTEQNRDYSMTYIHPRDMDAGQPRIKGLPLSRRFRSYVGLKGAEQKLRRYAGDFDFVDVATAEGMIDWDRVPVVRL